jgi:hypothetical protein
MATRGIVLNGCYGGFGLSEEGKNLLTQMGMSRKMADKIAYSHDPNDRMHPLLVSMVNKEPDVFNSYCTELYVYEVTVDAIKADAISIDEYDGTESVVINWEKVALWKKSNEQPKILAAIEAAIKDDAPKAEVMRLLEEFKKTIPPPMPSKPVPDELPCSDSEDDE